MLLWYFLYFCFCLSPRCVYKERHIYIYIIYHAKRIFRFLLHCAIIHFTSQFWIITLLMCMHVLYICHCHIRFYVLSRLCARWITKNLYTKYMDLWRMMYDVEILFFIFWQSVRERFELNRVCEVYLKSFFE